jgi:hypothetical protein
VRQGQKLDRPNDDKPAPKKRKASENDQNPRGEKRNAPAKATGAKSPPLNPAAEDANAEATSSQESATQKTNPKAVRCPEFRGDITCVDGQKKIFCKKCQHTVSYNGWGQHCTAHHSEKDHTDIVDQSKSNDNDGHDQKDDDGDQTDNVQPEVADAV